MQKVKEALNYFDFEIQFMHIDLGWLTHQYVN